MSIELPTAADVKAIVTTSLDDPVIEGIITDASLMVEHCVASLSASRQKAIIKYVTAHLLTSMTGLAGSPKTLTQRTLGDANESYSTATLGANLAGTMYGQQAISLDPTGCVANIGKKKAFCKLL